MRTICMLIFCGLLALTVSAADRQNMAGLSSTPEFKQQDFEGKLKLINEKSRDGTLNFDMGEDHYVERLYWEELHKKKSAQEMINFYAGMRKKYPTPSMLTSLEQTLVADYLTKDPMAVKANLVGKMKLLTKLVEDDKIDWTSVGDLLQGMLLCHLAQNGEFQKMNTAEKIAYISKLASDKVFHPTTPTNFQTGYAISSISQKTEQNRKEAYDNFKSKADFFLESNLKKAFPEFEKN